MHILIIGSRRRLSGHVAMWVVLVLLMVAFVASCKAQQIAAAAGVRAAWGKRHQQIQAFHYDCELTETRLKIERADPSDLADEHVRTPPVVVHKSMKFSGDVHKIALLLQGEDWLPNSRSRRGPYRFRAAFDGVDDKYLVEHGRLRMGQINRDSTAGPHLTNGINQVPFYLWCSSAKWLQSNGYVHEKMIVSQPHVKSDGGDCIEFSMPRGNGWIGFICVDPSRDYVPIRFIQQRDGVVRNSFSIGYRRDNRVGWIVSSWEMRQYSKVAELEQRIVAKVTDYSVNDALIAKTFDFEFPVGTHVGEKDGTKQRFFVALANGQRRYISGTEFGKMPAEKLDTRYTILKDRLPSLGGAGTDERAAILADLTKYMRQDDASRPHVVLLLNLTAYQVYQSSGPEEAIKFCRELAEASDDYHYVLTKLATRIEGRLRRSRLVGSPLVITGKTIEGMPFDWKKYRGKVVLVFFWSTACEPCREELPRIKKVYDAYRSRGLDVVGICCDTDEDTLRDYLKKERLGWTTVYEPGVGPETNAARYDVRAFPTSFLVDRDGRVASDDVEGDEMASSLVNLLDTP